MTIENFRDPRNAFVGQVIGENTFKNFLAMLFVERAESLTFNFSGFDENAIEIEENRLIPDHPTPCYRR